MATGDRIGNWRGRVGGVGRDCPLANGTGEPGRAGADAAGLPGRALLFQGGAGRGGAPSDRPALCRAGVGLWSDGSAKAWVVDLACRKAKELGYPHELWTTRLLARHAREHGPAQGHTCLAKLAQGTLCNILNEQEIKPHKVRYYLERRDPEFKQKMAEVLCVYREVKLIKETAAAAKQQPSDAVAIVSYDEKPGIQAIATTAPDLPPQPGGHATFARDHEYKRLGTVSLLAGIDLLTGQVHALVKDRHRSREFIEFLKILDAAYPAHTAIKLILDNHSAHISKETKAWLVEAPAHRFEFVFTPKHGSWLNLVEGFFSKLARSVLRHIRVASKQELKDRITIPSSTLGPISSIRPPDMIRTSETMTECLGQAWIRQPSLRPSVPANWTATTTRS